MRYYAAIVSEALQATPPKVRGLIDGATVRRLMGFRGTGRKRVFVFDILGEVQMSDLLDRKMDIALERDEEWETLPLSRNALRCPACSLELLGDEFWGHYDTHHARRPGWLNSEDWSRMGLRPPYLVPPEQR